MDNLILSTLLQLLLLLIQFWLDGARKLKGKKVKIWSVLNLLKNLQKKVNAIKTITIQKQFQIC